MAVSAAHTLRSMPLHNQYQFIMDNYISYTTHGKSFSFETNLCFTEDRSDESVAIEVYLEVRGDSETRMASGEMPHVLGKDELKKIPENERDWYKITNIEFVDTISKKKLSMTHMYDFSGTYNVEPLLVNL